ncbi:exported protein of unknown function [Micropruina glycogenica]|uniref:Uncharacterized protein n=1 Tax=Micropruina glycogenica TaxID=75385 RepID=A0A2N9JL62_9ACTN|nr:exported protein of unknown function [Micropruina glycogenica]
MGTVLLLAQGTVLLLAQDAAAARDLDGARRTCHPVALGMSWFLSDANRAPEHLTRVRWRELGTVSISRQTGRPNTCPESTARSTHQGVVQGVDRGVPLSTNTADT